MPTNLPLPLAPLAATNAHQLLRCNETSARFGLALTPEAALRVAEAQQKSLLDTNRIDFGTELPQKIIYAFCDSPFIAPAEYEDTLIELVDTFYHFKNATWGAVADDELIAAMQAGFNGVCQGSLELLRGRELEMLAVLAHGGTPEAPDLSEEDDYEQ